MPFEAVLCALLSSQVISKCLLPYPGASFQVTKRDDPDEAKVEALRAVAGEGEKVWVKVISVAHDPERGTPKVGCSMKLVSQSDGADKDPSNLKLAEQSKPQPRGPQKVQDSTVHCITAQYTVQHHSPVQCSAMHQRMVPNGSAAQCAVWP